MSTPRVAVVGDVFLDTYVECRAKKVSPSHHGVVYEHVDVAYRPGGAAAVAAMAAALGLDVSVYGVVGSDPEASRLTSLLENSGTRVHLSRAGESTMVKTRYHASNQILMQLDSPEPAMPSINWCKLQSGYDGWILCDYNKGTLSAWSAADTRAASQQGLVLVDPPAIPFGGWHKYKYADAVIPNISKLGDVRLPVLLSSLSLAAAICTAGKHGVDFMSYEDRDIGSIKARPSKEIDPTGASDQFIAALMYARLNHMSWRNACAFAVIAAGRQVEEFGCVPIPLKVIQSEYRTHKPRKHRPGRSQRLLRRSARGARASSNGSK